MAVTVYATKQDIINTGLPAAALENVTDSSITEALVNASSVADSYLASTYTLPFNTINGALTQRTAEIAAWLIVATRGFNPSDPRDTVIRMRYDDAIKFFDRVSARRATLVGVVDSASPANSNPSPRAQRLPTSWDCI
jgi:phage gp36-like protein